MDGKPDEALEEEFEYIVVGSGAGGGPLAANLALAGYRVLVLEAGGPPAAKGTPADYNYQVPVFNANASEEPEMSWKFFVRHYDDPTQQEKDWKNRPKEGGIFYPRAGTLGGCTAHNAMIFIYPHNSDWDRIAELTGDPSWGARSMRRYYQRLEECRYRKILGFLNRHLRWNPSLHGFAGWLASETVDIKLLFDDWSLLWLVRWSAFKNLFSFNSGHGKLWDLAQAFKQLFFSVITWFDPNSWWSVVRRSEGFRLPPLSRSNGSRTGSRERLLEAQQKCPDRLTVRLGALATRVLFDADRRAVGVVYLEGDHVYRAAALNDSSQQGTLRRVRASREVILAGGAFNTPQLLQLSGVGPAELLKRHDIPVVVDLPGVGANLQDRYEISVVLRMNEAFSSFKDATLRPPKKDEEPDPQFKEWQQGKGVYTSNGAAMAFIKRSRPELLDPDLFVFALVTDFRGYYPGYSKRTQEARRYFTWAVLKGSTKNTAGKVEIRSDNPREVPDINFNYFTDGAEQDLDAVVQAIRFIRGITKGYGDRIEAEELPGSAVENTKDLEDYVRNEAWGHHASCTCKIGTADDPMAVLDSDFRVRGTTGLRVVDASVFPHIPGLFIVSAVYMIAEKASDVILADAERNDLVTNPENVPQRPVPFRRVLWDELKHLKNPAANGGELGEPIPTIETTYERLGNLPDEEALSALCFSGGGIRSATFNLGVIQALAKLGLLVRFDYLSSCSGGGYIAGWLKTWLHRQPIEEVAQVLADSSAQEKFDPLLPEPPPLRHLREYSNYLTPRLGLFSPDTWTAAALIIRNMLLNWLVLVPALTAFVGIPQVAFIVASGASISEFWGQLAIRLALILALWTSAAIYHFRLQRQQPPSAAKIVLLGVVPLWLSCLCLATAALCLGRSYGGIQLWKFCLLWCMVIPLLGWLTALLTSGEQKRDTRWQADLAGIVLSGGVATVILYGIATIWLPLLKRVPAAFVILGVPILLGLYLLARALFVAFASLGESKQPTPPGEVSAGERANGEREWWARLSGWLLLLALAWMAGSALIILGGVVLAKLGNYATAAAAGMGGISGLLTAFLGKSKKSAGKNDEQGGQSSPLVELVLKFAAPLTFAFIIILVAKLSALVGSLKMVTGLHLEDIPIVLPPTYSLPLPFGRTLPQVVLSFVFVPLGFAFLSWLLGWVVDVNRFSAQGLYRNRLVRAYLGASNLKRKPEPFTGFDPNDNVRLHELAKGASPRPLSVIGTTLNLVGGSDNLAWQQRKSESFSMTPLYCGNFNEGYRRSDEYGGPDGISLGTAITISGAAANPSSGYHSSPLVAFLLTLFNVRLGSWLGNTNEHGEKVYRCSGPRHAWKPLFADLFSRTNRNHPYVSLSDGGHFENLGVYEMVLRRCRFILSSDAGQDPEHGFEDLGNLIRKVRIDFGIPIEFGKPIRILARTSGEQHGLYCAIGTIRYDAVDKGAKPGTLLYVKPTILVDNYPVPYDVYSYSRSSKLFPHEPTSDQWFTESQFESYRALGQFLAIKLAGHKPYPDVPALFAGVEGALDDTP